MIVLTMRRELLSNLLNNSLNANVFQIIIRLVSALTKFHCHCKRYLVTEKYS